MRKQAINYQFSVKSNLPGRIRFKINKLYKNKVLARQLKSSLIKLDGLSKIETNIYSKSLLILYDRQKISDYNIKKKLQLFLNNYKIAIKQRRETIKCTASTSEEDLALKPNKENKKYSNDNQWYQLTTQQIVDLLNTNPKQGLREEQAQALLQKVGPNKFKEKEEETFISIFLSQFNDFITKILLGTAGISFFVGQIGDAITILTITLVEALLGTWQEYKAEKSLNKLQEYATSNSKVIRDASINQISSEKLVPGDIISFEAGDLIPADAKLIESSNLKLNEANLTGESESISKSHKIEYTSPTPLADRKNMVFMGTTVVKGTGKAVIVETGMRTQMGQIAEMMEESQDQPTPLQKDLKKLGKVITWSCLGICGGIMITGLLTGQPLVEVLRNGVSLAIGTIPEGLATMLTIALAFGVKRMSKKGAIVKELPTTETLSCADVICTDKTGTLTKGQMTVTDISTINSNYEVSGRGYSTDGDFLYNGQRIDPNQKADLKQILKIGSLCNNASVNQNSCTDQSDSLEIVGDPTESALRVLAAKADLTRQDYDCYTREKEIAFDSETKKMTVVCKEPSNKYSINVKGAPDVILSKCTKILDGDQVRKLTNKDTKQIKKSIDQMADQALRVMGFAYKELDHKPTNDYAIEENLVFVGLTGMIDPPRPEVKSAIERCNTAGIKTVMITGDHKKTAKAIGRKINLLEEGDKVLTGQELNKLSDEQLLEEIDDIAIFARTSPEQKLRIVKSLKEKKHIIAMTGDGVNDAPAIKEANIGISMGQNGTDVTRDSSAIILTDDNFATIVKAIEEGRGISSNIKNFIKYVLTGNLGEALAIFIASIIGVPIPLAASQILLIDLITEGIPALSLGVDPPAKENMTQSPRDANKSLFDKQLLRNILSKGVIMGLSTFGLYISSYLWTGNLVKARTIAFATLIANQMFNVFDCSTGSSSKNKYILPSVVTSSLILLGSIYIPLLSGIFGTCPLRFSDWIIILFLSSFTGRLNHLKEKVSQITVSQPKPALP
ncbi:calcium-transporting P-type ATPase, PMR1-type [Halanaerocella petrolearia]